ncbi:MAG: hypothetical protein AB9891_18265 [Anaerolineaceae bacterium]
MVRVLHTLLIALFLTACAPTVAPVPATVTAAFTVTPIPTLTSTVEPSATPKPTATEKPTVAPTEVGPPPDGFFDWAEARKYGWVESADGKPEQHLVTDKDGLIIFGDLLLDPVEIKYEEHGFNYKFPVIGRKNKFPSLNFFTSIEPSDAFHYIAMSFLVKNPAVLNNPPFAASGEGEARFEVWMEEWDEPYAWSASQGESAGLPFSLTTSADDEDPVDGALAITILVPKAESLKTIKLNRPGYPLMVIFEADKK